MKILKKLLYGVLCIILLFTFSQAAEEEHCVSCYKTSGSVKIAWDPTTTYLNGNPIPERKAVRYNVYIRKCNENMIKKICNKTDKTEYVIPFQERGKYFVGVDAVYVKKSEKSWSCDPEKCLNKDTFCVEFE
ncbi:MAG: hypothetical protein QNJ58_23435 [Desulfobacterales bacterium]|nr:hypothetical protein [Desulfobacterales bacterium]